MRLCDFSRTQLEPVVTMPNDTRTPAAIWQTTLGELELQMPREAFNTWLRGARLLAQEDGTYVIGVHNTYARDWLEQRLRKVILRTLSHIAGRSVEVRFVVWTGEPEREDLRSAGPLLADLETSEAPVFDQPAPDLTGLNPRYRLDDYVVGPGNRMAHAAAAAVLDPTSAHFNPLVIHAGVGLGKTHLLHAVGNAAHAAGLKALFISAERFTNDLVAAIKSKRMNDFRDKYRSANLLLMDDLDFIAGKESTQEELYHTFNILYDAGAQIIFAGNQPPSAIRRLDPRLMSRFEGGLVVEISPPDFETRLEILRTKTRLNGYEGRIPLEVLEVIAEESTDSVRELEGALNRLVAAALLDQGAPTVNLAETAIEQLRASQSPGLMLGDVILAVAGFYDLMPEELTGRGRSRDLSAARQVTMYLAYKHTSASLQQIGAALGGRNHSTVLYSCERIGDLMATDSMVRRDVQAILQMLRPERVSRE